MEGITLSIIFSIIVSLMSGHVFILDPQYDTQTDFVNYQVVLLPKNLELVGRDNLQLNYDAHVSEYYYFTDNSFSDSLLKFYNVYAYALYGKRVKSVDELMSVVSSANYPVYPVNAIAVRNTQNIQQDLKLVKLFYVMIEGNKYLIIPYTTSKYVFLPIVSGNSLFKVGMVSGNGIESVNASSVITDIKITLSDIAVERSGSELDVSVSGSYTKNGVSSVEISNPNDYYVVVTLFNYMGGVDDYVTVYVPPASQKHLNLNFMPTHAVVWRGFRPVLMKLSLSYIPSRYMMADKTVYYEGETIRVKLLRGNVGDYDISAQLMSSGKRIQVFYQSELSNYFQLQAPSVDAFSDDVLKITLFDKETGLIVESLYLTIKSRVYVKDVHVDLEEGRAVINLSKPLNSLDVSYSVDVITHVCPVLSGEDCGVLDKKLSSFDLESPSIIAELKVSKLQIGYNKISIILKLTDPTGRTIQFSKTVYKYVSPSLFINDIKLDYNFMSGDSEYLYKGGNVKLNINVNNNILESKEGKKKLHVVIYVNNKEFENADISGDVTYNIPIRYDYNYLLVSVYVNNIQVYSNFYLTKPKPIYILILQNFWIIAMAILLVGYINYRQRQKHPEEKLMQKYDVRKVRTQIEEYLRMRVAEKIGSDALNVLFVYDVASNNYITAWVSHFSRKAYLLVTDMRLNSLLETEIPPEELLKMMQKINQGANPYEVAVDTYNTVKSAEISELARDVHEDLVSSHVESASIGGLDELNVGGVKKPVEAGTGLEEKQKGGFIDKLDEAFSDEIVGSESDLVETSGGGLDLGDFDLDFGGKEKSSENKKKGSLDDLDLDLDLDLDFNI